MFLCKKGRLHACFARGFGLEVAPFVMLRDLNQNAIEEAVEKKNGKVYFADGCPVGYSCTCKPTPFPA
jgi:hypothetical protein